MKRSGVINVVLSVAVAAFTLLANPGDAGAQPVGGVRRAQKAADSTPSFSASYAGVVFAASKRCLGGEPIPTPVR